MPARGLCCEQFTVHRDEPPRTGIAGHGSGIHLLMTFRDLIGALSGSAEASCQATAAKRGLSRAWAAWPHRSKRSGAECSASWSRLASSPTAKPGGVVSVGRNRVWLQVVHLLNSFNKGGQG